MGQIKKNSSSAAADAGIGRNRSPIDLSIRGSDVLLSGRFHRWQAATARGDDLDELTVRMAVDVTSPDDLTVPGDEKDLFAFRSETLVPMRPNLYIAHGRLLTASGDRPFEMAVEIPDGHNAFFSLSFVARKEELGPSWAELATGETGAGGIDAERLLDPRLGVRAPQLAAA